MEFNLDNDLHLLGVSFRTADVAVREALSFDQRQAAQLLTELGGLHRGIEVLVLSTCNRTEFYLAGSEPEAIDTLLKRLRSLRPKAPIHSCQRYQLDGIEAARHFLRVSCGLDSAVLGDVQVLGQVREAVNTAGACGTLGTTLGRLTQHALRAGKRARTQTSIGRGASSVGSALTDLLLAHPRTERSPTSARVLLIGAGDVARTIGRHLSKKGFTDLHVVNRSEGRAAELGRHCGAEAHPWAARFEHIRAADVVIAATSASTHVLSREDLQTVVSECGVNAPLFVDTGVPRNIDPDSAVEIIDIDGIRDRQTDALAAREASIPDVEDILERELLRFHEWSSNAHREAAIRELFEDASLTTQQTTELLRSLDGSASAAAEIERIVQRSLKQLLHRHVRRLRGRSTEPLSPVTTG